MVAGTMAASLYGEQAIPDFVCPGSTEENGLLIGHVGVLVAVYDENRRRVLPEMG